VDQTPFDLGACFHDSSPGVPLVFILSPGSDPMANLLTFAESKTVKVPGAKPGDPEVPTKVEVVSLGQGQGPFALKSIEKGVTEGHWVVLQNCHLAKSFMPDLEQACEIRIKQHDVHPDFRCGAFPITTHRLCNCPYSSCEGTITTRRDGYSNPSYYGVQYTLSNPSYQSRIYPSRPTDTFFFTLRLWLTSYPSPTFPVGILENSVKMTNEAPSGLKAGLHRTWTSDPLSDTEFFESSTKDKAWRKMVFGLAFFHSFVQVRGFHIEQVPPSQLPILVLRREYYF